MQISHNESALLSSLLLSRTLLVSPYLSVSIRRLECEISQLKSSIKIRKCDDAGIKMLEFLLNRAPY